MTMQKLRHFLLIVVLMLTASLRISAQDISVSVVPTAYVMPPQLGLYYSSPQKFFSVTISNTGVSEAQVYLGMQIEQIEPTAGITFSASPRRQPAKPFVVAAGSSYQLTLSDMKHLFDHIPVSDISTNDEYFKSFTDGTYGMLPEGTYELRMTAYRWDPQRVGIGAMKIDPEVVSHPDGGVANFRVCYKAQPPKFVSPTSTTLGGDPTAITFDGQEPIIWQPATLNCNPAMGRYEYDFRMVHLPDHVAPEVAINGAVTYQRQGLTVPQLILPSLEVAKLVPGWTYLCQVTARSVGTNTLEYVTIENQGKSDYLIFTYPDNTSKKTEDEKTDGDSKPDEGSKSDGPDSSGFIMGGVAWNDSINTDSLYTFRKPTIRQPLFDDVLGARKIFTHSDIPVKWSRVWHIGGDGLRPDTLEFRYAVELFNGKDNADLQATLATDPIYTFETKELIDTIRWSKIEKRVTSGDYLALRIRPIVTKGHSIAFVGDSLNVIDFALVDHVVKKYFECSPSVDITNRDPHTSSKDDLKGKIVAMGEYDMRIVKIDKGDSETGYSGEGRILWQPFGEGNDIELCVQFDTLRINTDMIAYGGIAKTMTAKETTSADAINAIFDDWGLDNLLSNANIPYADQITSGGKQALGKALQNKVEIGKYYEAVKQGDALVSLLQGKGLKDVCTPIAIADVIANESPVDIQIANMTFAPTWATMNIVGEFALPESETYKNEVLMFGAPRICISPERILPESGTLALLADFTVTDPGSEFEMTFHAPDNLLEPEDGCYVSWHADAFELLGIDVSMLIPDLVKDVNGAPDPDGALPELKFTATVGSSWDEWMVNQITMDPFQAVDLPGYTFTAQDVVYDHSVTQNSKSMGAFPEQYRPSAAVMALPEAWMGLYLSNLSVQFPKGLEFGDEADLRLAVAVRNLFIDDTGITFDVEGNDIFSSKTGKAGGWEFTLDDVGLRVIQNSFDQCYFDGRLDVPLLDGEIGYHCNIVRMMDGLKPSGDYSYLFLTQQLDSLSMDLFLADVRFKKEQTYFLVEAVPDGNHELQTNVELLMSGEISIGASLKGDLQQRLDELPVSINIPGVHFTKMRLANCRPWKSQFEHIRAVQEKEAKVEGVLLDLVGDQSYELVEGKVFFNRGAWSLASLQKDFGPFKLSVDRYDINMGDVAHADAPAGKSLDLSIVGTIGVLDTLVTATAGFTVKTEITGLDKAVKDFDLAALGFRYHTTTFDSIDVKSHLPGLMLRGHLGIIRPTDAKPERGFDGMLKITVPGDLFSVEADGGFYHHEAEESFKWGYFRMRAAAPVPMPPVQLTDIRGGFFFNCAAKGGNYMCDKSDVTPTNGAIGAFAGVGLSTTGSDNLVSGDMTLAFAYNKRAKVYDRNGGFTGRTEGRFTTIRLDGEVNALCSPSNPKDGLIKGKACMVYFDDETAGKRDRYLQLNVTADAGVDIGSDLFKQLTGIDPSEFENFASDLSEFGADAASGGGGSKTNADDADAAERAAAKSLKGGMNAHASFDLRFELPIKDIRTSANCKWHVYVGVPTPEEDRCSITLIDFQLGDKDDPVAVWGKLYANAYICFGNELPDNGKLPPIPNAVTQFLNGSKKNGVSGATAADATAADDERKAAVDRLKSKGGVMFGAAVGGTFGCNAVIAYARVEAMAGFDVVLKRVTGAGCSDGRSAGKNGWYGMGQVYAYLSGEMGLMLNLWIYKGNFPLCDMGVGMLMQGGFPNPSWFYGKARARCSLFGGLIEFDKAINVKCGDVCTPLKANPLEDVDVFGDSNPEFTTREEGHDVNNAVSPYNEPRFSTNMRLDTDIRLVSEDEADAHSAATKAVYGRTYRFSIDENKVAFARYSGAKGAKVGYDYTVSLKTTDKKNFTLSTGALDSKTYYGYRAIARAQELVNGQYVDPWFEEQDETTGHIRRYQKAWKDTLDVYFYTGQLPETLDTRDIAYAFPGNSSEDLLNEDQYMGTWDRSQMLYPSEVDNPYLTLVRSRADLFEDGAKTLWGRIEVKDDQYAEWRVLEETPWTEYGGPDGGHAIWRPTTPSRTHDYNTLYTTKEYRLTLLLRDEAEYKKYMQAAEKTEKKTATNAMDSTQKTLARVKAALNEAAATGGETYDLKAKMSALEVGDNLASASDSRTKTYHDYTKSDHTATFYKLIYQKRFKVVTTNYPDLISHIQAVASGKVRKYGKGAAAVMKFLGESPRQPLVFTGKKSSGKTTDVIDYPAEQNGANTDYKTWYDTYTKDPYSVLAYWHNFGFVKGKTIPAYDYQSWKQTTSESVDVDLNLETFYSGSYAYGPLSGEYHVNPEGSTYNDFKLRPWTFGGWIKSRADKSPYKTPYHDIKEFLMKDCQLVSQFETKLNNAAKEMLGKNASGMKSWNKSGEYVYSGNDQTKTYYNNSGYRYGYGHIRVPYYQLALARGIVKRYKKSAARNLASSDRQTQAECVLALMAGYDNSENKEVEFTDYAAKLSAKLFSPDQFYHAVPYMYFTLTVPYYYGIKSYNSGQEDGRTYYELNIPNPLSTDY